MGGNTDVLDAVVEHMSEHSELSEQELRDALAGLLEHLNARALSELQRDSRSDNSTRFSIEYLACTQMLTFFGAALIAMDDIDGFDRELSPDESN